MMTYSGSGWVKCLIFTFLLCNVSSLPNLLKDEGSVKEIFSETKRDVSPAGSMTAVPLVKSPLFNPLLGYPLSFPSKPFFGLPLVNSPDLLLNRLTKSTPVAPSSTKMSALQAGDPTLISSYFLGKKEEFLNKLFDTIANSTGTGSNLGLRSVLEEENTASTSKMPALDSSYFLKKKYQFMEALFKSLNTTVAPEVVNTTDGEVNSTETPKPTIVPPDFWFPFVKLPKTPKPPKPPKPTKPPKAKKVLKDALDTILLQSLLLDLGVDPKDATFSKRTVMESGSSKKSKSKNGDNPSEKFLKDKEQADLASNCVDKLFKLLNATMNEDLELKIKPKTTTSPKSTLDLDSENASKLDSLLQTLIMSFDENKVSLGKPEKSKLKSKGGKKFKRSTFLDELLHRVTTSPPTTITEPTPPTISDSHQLKWNEGAIKEFLAECCCPKDTESEKSARSLLFRPFGTGLWVPQYLYAAKMGMYLDKLMDSINTAAASDVASESTDVVKRSANVLTENFSGISSKEVAIDLIIAVLGDLKNNMIDAFTDALKAQKDAFPTQKPYGPPGKSFKKPFWGPQPLPTADPVVPIQKRIDVLSDVFDKLTKVERTLIFTSEPEYDSKLVGNLTDILNLVSPLSQTPKMKVFSTKPSENPESPAFFLAKTREYLLNLYGDEKSR